MALDLPRFDPGDMDDAPDAPDAPEATAVARVERRLAMLDELAEIGMTLARDLAWRAAAPLEDTRREPGPAFAQISRAVRLTLAMQATLEAEILAIRNGEGQAPQTPQTPQGPEAWRPPTRTYLPGPAPGEPDTRDQDQASKDSACPQRNRIRDAVWNAIEDTSTSMMDSFYTFDRLHERLVEGEVYDQVLFRPWRETVAAICDDLDLEPDWSQWSDETGFPPTRKHPLVGSWSYWHKQAAWHRKKYIEKHGSEPAPKPPPTPRPPNPPVKGGPTLE